jgi:hypothetical protein
MGLLQMAGVVCKGPVQVFVVYMFLKVSSIFSYQSSGWDIDRHSGVLTIKYLNLLWQVVNTSLN